MVLIRGIIGVTLILGIGYLLSSHKKHINKRLILYGLIIEVIIGLLLSKVDFIRNAFSWISELFVTVLNFTNAGTEFLFGQLVKSPEIGFVFALQVLPIVIFFATLSAGLYYLGVLQIFVKGFAKIMSLMHISGAESVAAAGNIFLGQTEAPLLIKPFIAKMTQSELMCLMVVGMATISGSVLAGYVFLLSGENIAEQNKVASYLLSASIMNVPAGIILSKLILPESEPDKIDRSLVVSSDDLGINLLDALAKGTTDGLKMALNIGAMLIVFIALIAGLNYFLTQAGEFLGLNELIVQSSNGQFNSLTLEYILGQVFRLFAFAIGIDWHETIQVGSLLGKKMVVNEFVAYADLGLLKTGGLLSERAVMISTFALCGFANFGSIAIQIAGIGGLIPSQKKNLARLGVKALLAASLANLLTASLVGFLF